MRPLLIAPSILSADFAKLGEEVRAVEAAGADWIHVDVMDNHFVPNLTIGPMVVKALRKHSTRPFDVHLMVTPVDALVPAFAEAGAEFEGADIVVMNRVICCYPDMPKLAGAAADRTEGARRSLRDRPDGHERL